MLDMMIEETIDIHVAPERVMDCYRDVAGWPHWDPDTMEAAIDGPFRTGATGRLRPATGFAVPMRFTRVTDSSFTVECRAPLCKMHFEHELIPITGGTRVTHRVSFTGPLAGFFGRVVGARVRIGLPVTMATLKGMLENAA
jgi:hypothetical protein